MSIAFERKVGNGFGFLPEGSRFTWDDKGNISRVIGTNVDITRQKNAEIALKESEERFSILADISNTGIAHHDIICNEIGVPVDCRFLYVNEAFERITGRNTLDIIGKTLQEVFPGIVPRWLKYLGEVALTGKTIKFSKYSPSLGGYFDVIAFCPRIGQFTIMLSDTSDQRAAQEAFIECRTLLESTESLAKIGGWEWDVEAQIMKMTEETYRIYGFEPGGLVPGSPEYFQRSSACYHPDDRRIINDLFSRCIRDKESFNREFPITTVDGRHIWIQIIAQAVIDGDRVVKIIGSIMDITDRKIGK